LFGRLQKLIILSFLFGGIEHLRCSGAFVVFLSLFAAVIKLCAIDIH